MTELVQHQPQTDMGAFDEQDESMLRYLGLNPNSPQDRAAVAVCRHYGFDPLLKHVVVIPKGGVYITRDGLLSAAHRSAQLDGIVVEQAPTLDRDANEWVATVSVYRKDMRFPFTYPGRYPANGGNRQYAPEMALKCAEAHALRRAFDIGGLPTLDEQKPGEAPAPAPVKAAGLDAIRHAVAPENTDDTVDAEVVEETGEAITATTRGRMFALFTERGITDADQQRAGMSKVLGRTVESRADLTEADGQAIIASLEGRVA